MRTREGMLGAALLLALLAVSATAAEKSISWSARGALAGRPASSRTTTGVLYVATDCGNATCTSSTNAGQRECVFQDTGSGWDLVVCGTTSSTTTTTTTTSTTTTT